MLQTACCYSTLAVNLLTALSTGLVDSVSSLLCLAETEAPGGVEGVGVTGAGVIVAGEIGKQGGATGMLNAASS